MIVFIKKKLRKILCPSKEKRKNAINMQTYQDKCFFHLKKNKNFIHLKTNH